MDATELGAKTRLKFNFSTTNPIPLGSRLIITLPSNLRIATTPLVLVNNRNAVTDLNSRAFILTITNFTGTRNFEIII